MRRRFRGQFALIATAVVVLIVSLILLTYANWLRGIDGGNQALASGDAASARQKYDDAAKRVAFVPLPGKLLPAGYRELVFNRARALYAEGRDDVLARFLESEGSITPQLADDSEYLYWIGNVQFRQAIAQKEKQQIQSGLQQAIDSYRRALAASPDDWDVKYNYELSSRLLDGMRKGKDDDSIEKMKRGQMKLLREDGEKKQERQRQVAPEKRG